MASDTQGYSPYGYGMDTPVRVRNTVSYGRGWMLLRSRGVGSNATGPCDPPQLASSCDCSSLWRASPADEPMPRCIASAACAPPLPPPPPAASAAIVFALSANASSLRFYFGGKAAAAYAAQLQLLLRALASLRAVRTALPVCLLASGERPPHAEARLAALGVRLIAAPPLAPPPWASPWARASFAKLRALALTQFERVILLDNDVVVFRNIDHLATLAAPAFVFGYKCYPRRELRTSLILLQPSRALWARAARLLRGAAHVFDDNGEGSVWRQLHEQAYELPAGYAALRSSNFSAAEWAQVHVLHDPNLLRGCKREGFVEAQVARRVKQLDIAAQAEMKLVGDIVSPKAASGGRGRRGRRRGRRLAR
ncbi:hypothetical protein AB1Y20_012387 [Prymnesium parvum]|uniref:Hexosyltransferase n=1 Tax=Prymnesium parvum TaxID=97485 RepID=A0AB34INC9_PRYPA